MTVGDSKVTGGGVRTGADWAAFLGTAVLILVADQVSKAWLVSAISPGKVVTVVGDLVRLVSGSG